MSNVLPIQSKPTSVISFTAEQVETIKKTVAKGATNEELDMFSYLCQKYGLDPFLKEIWFIKRVKKVEKSKGVWDYPRLSNGEIDYKDAETVIMTSRDGYLKIAQNNPDFLGLISFVVREGDTFSVDAANYDVKHEFASKRGKILGAWAKCERKNRKPVICFVDFIEYNQTNNTTWGKYPSAMIQKTAEVFVLKRQFGISGLVTQEEIEAEVEDASIIEPKPTDIPASAKKTVINISPEPMIKEENNPSTVQEPVQDLSGSPQQAEQVEPSQSETIQEQGSKVKQSQAETKVKPLGTREYTLLGAKMQPIADNKTLWILAVDLGDGRKTMLYLDPSKADEFESLGVGEGDKVKITIAQSGNTIIAQEVEVVK